MKKRVLDTSVLIKYWRQCRRITQATKTADVVNWAKKLIEMHDSDAIVTPVCVEILAGVASRSELQLTRAYLQQFRCIDNQRITSDDWQNAIRLAQWIPRDSKPRDLGDCLIRAIADRLRYEVLTYDRGFPR